MAALAIPALKDGAFRASRVKAALTSLGKALPVPNPYPDILSGYLYRHVTVMPMKTALALIERTAQHVFIKPADRWKSFNGCVPADGRDIRLNGASRNQNVWVSDVVGFRSEWRAYVLRGEIRYSAIAESNRTKWSSMRR